MKKLLNSLPFRLLAGVIIGILVGLIANEIFYEHCCYGKAAAR